jgi:hypothetical protein
MDTIASSLSILYIISPASFLLFAKGLHLNTVARADNYFAEYRMLFSRRRGKERDIFEIALDGTSLFRGSCSDVIKSR